MQNSTDGDRHRGEWHFLQSPMTRSQAQWSRVPWLPSGKRDQTLRAAGEWVCLAEHSSSSHEQIRLSDVLTHHLLGPDSFFLENFKDLVRGKPEDA